MPSPSAERAIYIGKRLEVTVLTGSFILAGSGCESQSIINAADASPIPTITSLKNPEIELYNQYGIRLSTPKYNVFIKPGRKGYYEIVDQPLFVKLELKQFIDDNGKEKKLFPVLTEPNYRTSEKKYIHRDRIPQAAIVVLGPRYPKGFTGGNIRLAKENIPYKDDKNKDLEGGTFYSFDLDGEVYYIEYFNTEKAEITDQPNIP